MVAYRLVGGQEDQLNQNLMGKILLGQLLVTKGEGVGNVLFMTGGRMAFYFS
jgi:hypothetical protein